MVVVLNCNKINGIQITNYNVNNVAAEFYIKREHQKSGCIKLDDVLV